MVIVFISILSKSDFGSMDALRRIQQNLSNYLDGILERRLKETAGGGVSNMGSRAKAGKMDCLLYRRR
jgi:hypothetical protein